MKLMKKTGTYRASNVSFNPQTLRATSYAHWTFVAQIDGLVVFNNYRYSNTTSRHQAKVRRLLSDLGISIDLELTLPKGITAAPLAEQIVKCEEHLCEVFLNSEFKKQVKSDNDKLKRRSVKLEQYLDQVAFRDYEIKSADLFGEYNVSAVHQVVTTESIEFDVQNALRSFHRDGFGRIVFYLDIAA